MRRYFPNGGPAWPRKFAGPVRPGIIIGGRCVMAPSKLDTLKNGDSNFIQNSRNGICVTVDGQKVMEGIGAYDEATGEAVMLAHGDLTFKRGRVRATPGAFA